MRQNPFDFAEKFHREWVHLRQQKGFVLPDEMRSLSIRERLFGCPLCRARAHRSPDHRLVNFKSLRSDDRDDILEFAVAALRVFEAES